MSLFRTSLCVAAFAACSLADAAVSAAKPPQRANASRYELVNQCLAPVIAVLTRNGSAGNHAFDFEASIADAAGLPEPAKGARLRIAYEFPDKLRVDFPTPGGLATVCRNGQSVWAFPASLFQPIVERIDPPISSDPLPPMEVDSTKAVFLPALLDVRDGGRVSFAEHDYRIVDVRPIAFTTKQQQANDWPGRLWINPDDHRLAQIALRFSTWSVTLHIEKLAFAPALPPETWNPTAEQHDQVTAVPGEKIFTLIDLALKQKR